MSLAVFVHVAFTSLLALSRSSPLLLLFSLSFFLLGWILLESLNASILKYPSGDKVVVVVFVVAAVNKVARLPLELRYFRNL